MALELVCADAAPMTGGVVLLKCVLLELVNVDIMPCWCLGCEQLTASFVCLMTSSTSFYVFLSSDDLTPSYC